MISGSLTGALFANAFVLNARFRDREALNGNALNGRRRHGRNDVPDFAANPAAHMLMGAGISLFGLLISVAFAPETRGMSLAQTSNMTIRGQRMG